MVTGDHPKGVLETLFLNPKETRLPGNKTKHRNGDTNLERGSKGLKPTTVYGRARCSRKLKELSVRRSGRTGHFTTGKETKTCARVLKEKNWVFKRNVKVCANGKKKKNDDRT